jgi:glucose-1-phosphate thymidylyltransferase
MNIIIPMAGMGKRMRPHTLTTAKPLIPIAGKPIVQRLVEDILATANEKVDRIAFIIAPHFGAAVEKMLLNVAADLGAQGLICYQEEAKGTAHAILCAQECLVGNVFIAFADTLFKADFKIDTTKDAIIWTQKVDDPSAFGVVKMDATGKITDFVEKPSTFVSDLAIIGVYYFKDGVNLKNELQYLIDNNVMHGGEYQLTTAMENMKSKGLGFYSDQVEEWLDCGNKEATVYTNQRILAIKQGKESLRGNNITLENATIIEPCFIGDNVAIKNAVVGPYVSLESGTTIENTVIRNSIIQELSAVKNAVVENSMLGKSVTYNDKAQVINLGDYSTLS